MSKFQVGVLALLSVLVVIALGGLILLSGRLQPSGAGTNSQFAWAESTPSADMIHRCNPTLSGDKSDTYQKEYADLMARNAGPHEFGALLKHYYNCPKQDAFRVYWYESGLDLSYGGTIVPTMNRGGNISDAWAEFSRGWDGA